MKITANEYAFITGRKTASSLYNYELIRTSWGYQTRAELKVLVYLLLFIPCMVFDFFSCLWDGGLKRYSLPERPRMTEDVTLSLELERAAAIAAKH